MVEQNFPFWAVFQVLENRLLLARVLGFPEIARVGRNPQVLREKLQRDVRRIMEREALPRLYRRQLAGKPSIAKVGVPLAPADRSAFWREPLPLVFPTLCWTHGEDAALAWVPALDLEVAAGKTRDRDGGLEREIRAALSRSAALSLPRLVLLQRGHRVRLERLAVAVKIRTAKERVLKTEGEREHAPSVLKVVASDWSRDPGEMTFGLEEPVEQLAELLAGRAPRSVLLVGAAGVGKTAVFRELVRRRADFQLGATPFWATSGARLVAGMSGFGMWQERCQQVIREAGRRRAILHLGNLVELIDVGKSEHNRMGIAAFLRPYVARGQLLAVAECTPEQHALIERTDPQVLSAFQPLTIREPDAERSRLILHRYAAHLGAALGRSCSEASLAELERLHRRYAGYSAFPGRPLRFLHALVHDHVGSEAIGPAHVLAAFARDTGLPLVLLDPAAPLDLGRTRTWFSDRVIGQPEAVDLIVDLLAITKAALARPRKPIASMLFIGPTGVGKTEMAKALAEFLFGSPRRLTRFDMSEYGDTLAVQRLAGGVFGSEGLLTAKVREQPFSVLLFDEFEKADDQFLDLLLQVLGEGRLTDAAGRLADFSNTVVILTSNLGAESYQQGTMGFGAGSAGQQREAARAHFEREVQRYLRPELYNRIDRLVPFAPLAADTIERITERHLGAIAERDGIRYRGVSMNIGAGVAAHLARRGFHARYGARPVLRTIERDLLAPLADRMNRYSAELPLRVEIQRTDSGLHFHVKPRTDAAGCVPPSGTMASEALLAVAQECLACRREVQALERCGCVRQLNNELFQLEREQKRLAKAQRRLTALLQQTSGERRKRLLAEAAGAFTGERLAQLHRLHQLTGRIADLAGRCCALEDRILVHLYAKGSKEEDVAELTAALEPVRRDFADLLLTLYCREFDIPDRITLALFSEKPAWLTELAGAYVGVARRHDLGVRLMSYRLPPAAKVRGPAESEAPAATGEATEVTTKLRRFWRKDRLILTAMGRRKEQEILRRERLERPEQVLALPQPGLLGIGLEVSGLAAAPRFAGESGVHLMRDPRAEAEPRQCLVEHSSAELAQYVPPAGITRRGGIATQDRRRIYDAGAQTVHDLALDKKIPWQSRGLENVVGELLEERLQRQLRSVLDEGAVS
jgi:ATP-dependent Clp protease ATP-binding subunit ClpA